MEIKFDPEKRRWTLEKRGIDFLDASLVFADVHYEIEDLRWDYGERRFRVFGQLHGRRVMVVWTPRGPKRRIIMMRHGHEDEFKNAKTSLD